MTRRDYVRAAAQVFAIQAGDWTHELPEWAPVSGDFTGIEVSTESLGNVASDYVRAVWTAEAYCLLFADDNPRFNQRRFLQACGLVE